MANVPDTTNVLTAVQELSLEQVEHRLAEIDGERAFLSLLRRSLAARERAKRRTQQRSLTLTENRHGE